MSNNNNMPGVRKIAGHGAVFIRKVDIKEMKPRQQIVEQLKGKTPAQPAQPGPKEN